MYYLGHVNIGGVCQKRISCFDGSIYIEGVGCVDCPPGTFVFNNTYCVRNATGCDGCDTDKINCGEGYRWNGFTCVPICNPGEVYK